MEDLSPPAHLTKPVMRSSMNIDKVMILVIEEDTKTVEE